MRDQGMHKQQEEFDQLKQQVAVVRRTRDSLCSYGPTLKREIMKHALHELQDPLNELGSKLGLEWGLLGQWFSEALPEEASVQSAQ